MKQTVHKFTNEIEDTENEIEIRNFLINLDACYKILIHFFFV